MEDKTDETDGDIEMGEIIKNVDIILGLVELLPKITERNTSPTAFNSLFVIQLKACICNLYQTSLVN